MAIIKWKCGRCGIEAETPDATQQSMQTPILPQPQGPCPGPALPGDEPATTTGQFPTHAWAQDQDYQDPQS